MDAIVTYDTGQKMKINIWSDGGGKGIFIDQIERDFMRSWNSDPRHAHKIVKVKVFRTGEVTMPDYIRQQLPLDYFKPNRPKVGDNISRENLKPNKGRKRMRIW